MPAVEKVRAEKGEWPWNVSVSQISRGMPCLTSFPTAGGVEGGVRSESVAEHVEQTLRGMCCIRSFPKTSHARV